MEWSGVGHDDKKKHFERLISEGALSHAYLFAGPEMIGKRIFAEDIIRMLVPHGYEPDVMRLSPERDDETGKIKDISVEAIRDLKSWIYLRPAGKAKAVIIDSAERLGDEAANTLLKVLEEPPAYAHFFLITGNPARVLPTIASRCERVDFRPLTQAQMDAVLSGRKLSEDDRQLVAAVAAGRPGQALALIDEKKLPGVARSISELQKVLQAGSAEKIAFAKKLADDENADRAVGWWLAYIHSRLELKPQLAPLAAGLMDLAYVLSQSHYNRRLAIEKFLLTAKVPSAK